MARNNTSQETVEQVLERYANEAAPEYLKHAEKFRNLDRWTGPDPVLLIVDAAGSASGLNYADIVKPNVEEFRREFVDTGKVESLADLAELEDDPEFEEKFTIGRPNIVYDVPQNLLKEYDSRRDDLEILKEWAETADPESYRSDPVGRVGGIGLATFQYLRMLAGAETVKPDIQVRRFVEELEEEYTWDGLETDSALDLINSCQWLADHSSYSMLEIDQIAWWTNSETTSLSNAH